MVTQDCHDDSLKKNYFQKGIECLILKRMFRIMLPKVMGILARSLPGLVFFEVDFRSLFVFNVLENKARV